MLTANYLRSRGISVGAALRRRIDAALPDIPFQPAFQQVADERDLVIGLREPNALGAQLLTEGYASKSLHIKAKSSASGPTAGFVAAHPAFGKLGAAGQDKQRQYIDAAIEHGAGRVPLRLSDERVKQLIDLGLIQRRTSDSDSDTLKTVSARYGDTTHDFTMKKEGDSELPWAVFHDSGEPVEILSNPEWIKGPSGPKSAVTADYDLFGLFPRGNRANNVRPNNPVARVVGPRKKGVEALLSKNAYLDRLRETGLPLHRDFGNIHFYGETIKNALNDKIKRQGYKGGLLVHHGDEGSNPFSPGQDFPLRFVIPHKPAFLVENNAQLQDAYRSFRQLGYSVEVNPAFSFPSWRRSGA